MKGLFTSLNTNVFIIPATHEKACESDELAIALTLTPNSCAEPDYVLFNHRIIFLILAGSASWWLSGYDTKLTGENLAQDRMRRGLRCGISLLLLEAGFWFMWQFWHYHDGASGVGYLVVTLPLAAVWGSCISEMVARFFNWLIDPDDNREFDPKKSERDLDAIARLVKHGHKEAAIRLFATG